MREKSKHIVMVLDLTKAKQAIINYAQMNGEDMEGASIHTHGTIGLVKGADDVYHLICSEGVEANTTLHGADIYWYVNHEKDGVRSIGIYPRYRDTFTLKELLEMPVEKEVSLDEFVRTFGDRLESNFQILEKMLSEKP